MWKKNRVWISYLKNIVAADVSSAVFLASYIRRIAANREYAQTLEVFDLNKYKVIKNPFKIQVALREKRSQPFIFVTCKN